MEVSSPDDTFKKPLLPATESPVSFKKPATPSLNKNDDVKVASDVTVPKSEDVSVVAEPQKVPTQKKSKTLINVPLPYEEPEWHGHPPPNFALEIIKNGTLITNLPIMSSLVVFGRLDVCDVVFEHPSVSRYHAVIQYCKGDDTHPKGFYLYDLGSTHGTFLNKNKISPKIYYKLKVGYILKFGGSSRLHIFQGPEDVEEEDKPKEPEALKEPEDNVCDWGMAEEAEEEDDLSENPFAISTNNEDLYIDDPKKTLRGWFEREGYELEYKVEEKGFRTFSCTVRLPVDNLTGEFLPVEASVGGKKKEAVIACALEACRTLDRLGLLRQSHQESRQKKRKKWEENDFYDSDEDTFYDRTGEIEKRREMRKRLAKKVEVNNFQTLTAKLVVVEKEIDEIQNKISSSELKDLKTSTTGESDPLDMYMSNLSESGSSLSDKFERRKLKLRLVELEKEKKHLEKLANIAKPASLPPIKKSLGFIGKRPQSKLKLTPVSVSETKSKKTDEQIEENDSDEEEVTDNKQDIKKQLAKEDSNKDNSVDLRRANTDESIETCQYGLILNPTSETNASKIEKVSLPDFSMDVDNSKELVEEQSVIKVPLTDSSKTSEIVDPPKELSISQNVVKKDKKQMKPEKPKKKDSSSKNKVDIYKTETSEYCTWMPPSNQSGDGMTHLNAKYGY